MFIDIVGRRRSHSRVTSHNHITSRRASRDHIIASIGKELIKRVIYNLQDNHGHRKYTKSDIKCNKHDSDSGV